MDSIVKRFEFDARDVFRIVQFTDLHLCKTETPDKFAQTIDLLRRVTRATKPDLIAITGDLTWGETMDDRDAMDALSDTLEELGVPWAPVLGNHDGDKYGRDVFASFLLNRPNCLFTLGDPSAEGHGNYIVSVGDEWFFYFMDSHEGEFLPGQLDWYRRTSAALPAQHNELAFFHVPIPEFAEVWDCTPCRGYNMEGVCCTKYNDGLFSAFARGGHMRGVFVGHDHINDFEGTLDGIRLVYGRVSGYQGYAMEGFPFGARIIDVRRGANDFLTQIYTEHGEMYAQKRLSVPVFRRKG